MSFKQSSLSNEGCGPDLTELTRRPVNEGQSDSWFGLSEGVKFEWAGIQTLWTLKTLKNYGRLLQ